MAGSLAHMVEHLPSKSKALSSKPSIKKKKAQHLKKKKKAEGMD
jgi:hypothetical protein